MDPSINSQVQKTQSYSASQMPDQTNQQNQNAEQSQPVQDQKVAPVSLPQKEQAPIISNDLASELIKPSEEEPKIPQEVKEIVKVESDKIPLTEEHKALGIKHAKESTLAQTQPSGMVKLPMTENEALKIIKTTKNSDSKHWLAVLIEKIYKQLRVVREKIKG